MDGFGEGLIWFFAAMLFAGNGGFFNRGNNVPVIPAPDYVTPAELNAGLNNVQTQNQLNQIALSSANNNY